MLKTLIKKILDKRRSELVWLLLPKFQFRAKCPMCAGPQGCWINTPHPALTSHKAFTGCFARQSRKVRGKNGFTLAEVLITLGIIGVVAAMTIPILMNNTQHTELYTAFKKEYSSISNAYESLIQDNGGSINGVYANSQLFVNDLCKKLSCSKICNAGDSQSDCFVTTNWKDLEGNTGWQDLTTNSSTSVILSDGSSFTIKDWSVNINNYRYTDGIYSAIYFDVNGPLKKPNVMGRDIFEIFIAKDKLVPSGAYGTDIYTANRGEIYCTPNTHSLYNGASCGAKLLSENGMKY